MVAPTDKNLSFDTVRDKNVHQLRTLNLAIFPLRYQDKYFQDAMSAGEFTKLAYYSDICVGAIACRLEKREGGGAHLYVMTLGVLAPYRRLGIGSTLLQNALELARGDENIKDAYVHVQVNNSEAVAFYKKYGFETTETIKDYYKRIEPRDCYKMAIKLQP
eukprot:jgi/Mesvir1/23198/Mv22662-RA.1